VNTTEEECREILVQLSRWELMKFIWYLRLLRLRQGALVWLHRSRLALPWTYRQIERGGG
jgi:hypothetical protein